MTKYDTWDSYFLPEPSHPEKARVLRNLLGATTARQLAEQERRVTLAKVGELERSPIPGNFDFDHHRAIHEYIFGDVYQWAGQPRTVDMGKIHRLWPAATIVENAPRIYSAIADENFLIGLDLGRFVERLAEHWGEVNVLHAFREGNTRSQRAFFHELCLGAGYVLDGAYLEANFGAFNSALESAMITGHSEGFAEFLAEAVHRK